MRLVSPVPPPWAPFRVVKRLLALKMPALGGSVRVPLMFTGACAVRVGMRAQSSTCARARACTYNF